MLTVSLQSTNISESVNSVLKAVTGRTTNFQAGRDQALRWAAAGLLQAEKGFRTVRGHKQLWMLQAALGRDQQAQAV